MWKTLLNITLPPMDFLHFKLCPSPLSRFPGGSCGFEPFRCGNNSSLRFETLGVSLLLNVAITLGVVVTLRLAPRPFWRDPTIPKYGRNSWSGRNRKSRRNTGSGRNSRSSRNVRSGRKLDNDRILWGILADKLKKKTKKKLACLRWSCRLEWDDRKHLNIWYIFALWAWFICVYKRWHKATSVDMNNVFNSLILGGYARQNNRISKSTS